ncbi:Alpha/beta hydrolase fold-1 [Mycena maculata]|uniref:Alpha/beta hydrolase fold-1 n=1 Tax=Mycena maculata TaxID=230809 RepID=A0AAD7HVE7_9AGAR|nr:Alpha/beta hydrolase fold-1 [Mycena maculata]
MTPLASQSYVFDPRPNFPLLLTAKRYWDPSSPHLNGPDGFTLILTHGTGFHKEQYEPTLQDLYDMIQDRPGGPKIREAWSIDCPNHGDAAILNEQTLLWGYEPIFGWQEYARGLHALLSGLGTGIEIDFKTRCLVFIGHSFSAAALVFALTYQPEVKPECLIMLEMMYQGCPEGLLRIIKLNAASKLMESLTEGSSNRRHIWRSRDEAYQLFKARPAWQAWDDRVLRIYVQHGFRSLPIPEYPNEEGVTTKCTRRQETATYRDSLAISVVYRFMATVVKRIPTHLVYGAVDDYLPRHVKDEFLRNGIGGEQNLASLTRIPDAGHLVCASL